MYLLKLIGEKECLCKFKIMSDSVKYYFEEDFGKEKTEEKYSQDVINIKELFRLLSVEDRILVKRIIAEEKIF